MNKTRNTSAFMGLGFVASLLLTPLAHAELQIDTAAVEEKCAEQLGIDNSNGSSAFIRSETGFEVRTVQGVLLYRMRRCVNRHRAELRNVKLRDRTQMRMDQKFWKAYDKVQEIRQRSEDQLRSSLRNKARLRQEILGKDPRTDKEAILRARSSRREEIRRKEIQERMTPNSRSIDIQNERAECSELDGRAKNLCMIEALRRNRRKAR